MSFASCQKDELGSVDLTGKNAVSFSAESIASLTKVSGSSWEKGDAIGIMAVSNDGCDYDNIKYTAADDGEIVSFTPYSDVIYLREDGAIVMYGAYYPYQENFSYVTQYMTYDISAQDGTIEAQSEVDVLESQEYYNPANGNSVEFQFEHSLTKVQITVSNHDDVSTFEDLRNLSVTLTTNRTQYDLLNGEAKESSDAKELKMVETYNDGDKAIFTVIVAPGEMSDAIIFTDGESSFSATLSIYNAKSGEQHNFTTTVGDQGLTCVELKSEGTIEWNTLDDSSLNTPDIEIVDGVYQIYTAAGLKAFASAVNSGEVSIDAKLMNNIDLNGSGDNQWTPIGWYTSDSDCCVYSGEFDGGGFEVSGLYIYNTDGTSGQYQGLFGYIGGATIKNLGVRGSVTGYQYVGGIVGRAKATSEDPSTISCCYNAASVEGSDTYVGGVVGSTSYYTTSDCYNIGSVKGSSRVGGIIGYVDIYSTITNCYNKGTIEALTDNVGGIVGRMQSSTTVNYCYSAGSVVSAAESSTYVGGVVGYPNTNNTNPSIVSYCYYDNTVATGVSGAVNSDDNGTDYCGLSTDDMQGSVSTIGTLLYYLSQDDNTGWTADTESINGGYPILTWQNSDNN